jgi:hypothetical protein
MLVLFKRLFLILRVIALSIVLIYGVIIFYGLCQFDITAIRDDGVTPTMSMFITGTFFFGVGLFAAFKRLHKLLV